jgi:hypothetical protein
MSASMCRFSLDANQEGQMIYNSASHLRIGFVGLAVTILTVGICGEAVAKTSKGRLHARGLIAASRHDGSKSLQAMAQQQPRLGGMRYYGGPKSPMWRGPAEE